MSSIAQIKDLSLSLNHSLLKEKLINQENILIIQDLDGVCMKLVKNPLDRVINWQYVQCIKKLSGHFFVLTNGEHIGKRGVNKIIEKSAPSTVEKKDYYLPGLAGGGVQWQDNYGNVSHPGVTTKELDFLASIPHIAREKLEQFCQQHCPFFTEAEKDRIIDAVILDNFVSPTINLNTFYEALQGKNDLYLQLQKDMESLMNFLLDSATKQGLNNSFFIHYAPNLGRDANGLEIVRPATENDSGTTDFQFMVTGAVKEAGVLFILNYYYFLQTGKYPLGDDFNVRRAPHNLDDLLNLIIDNFDPKFMPFIMGVGDTVNSLVMENNGKKDVKRGGSDRNFLQLINNLGNKLNIDSAVVYIDSSQGEIKNRKPLKLAEIEGEIKVISGPNDDRDADDSLTLNVVFPNGYQQYCNFLIDVANQKGQS
ncbi:MAG: glucosylglycerol 3-phosphatase [Cyanobacterium sp. T60_A2020_053]|nr:glucosylglycerol 3-phosphatase [Cyanobacterium sp. T60_A2020_053]